MNVKLNNALLIKNNNDKVIVKKSELKFIDGYANVDLCYKKDGMVTHYCTIVDDKMNLIVPFRKEILKDDNMLNSVMVFNNKKAIYGINNELFYLIDLDEVKFKKVEDILVPSKSSLILDGLEVLDENKIIAYYNNKSFIFDVSKNKVLSDEFEYMSSINNKKILGQYISKSNLTNPLVINCELSYNGVIDNKIEVNDITCWLSNEVINNHDNLLKEAANLYDDHLKELCSRELVLCKKLN